MLPLDYHFSPAKLEQKNIMILIHGYGGNAQDFIEVVPAFNRLPNTSFISLNAPFMIPHIEHGYQWFPLDYVNNHYQITSIVSVYKASLLLSNFVNYVVERYHVEKENIILFGFSQGAILSLCHGLYTKNKYGAIIAHSGAFYEPSLISISVLKNKSQNILLLHGEQDDIIIPFHFNKTKDFFDNNKIKYSDYLDKYSGHHLSDNTMNTAQDFILKNVYKN
jgi:phospholipase/carboxylesterase